LPAGCWASSRQVTVIERRCRLIGQTIGMSPEPLFATSAYRDVAGQGTRSSDPRPSPLATGPVQLAGSAKDRPRQRKAIMGRKDVMQRTGRIESAVADLPAVKVSGIAVQGIAAGGVALRALATAHSPLARQPLAHLR
jgi:hypothetical protein